MNSQQQADLLLAEHQANREARLRLSVIRSGNLKAFYDAERRAGVPSLIANERMHFHAKRLDGEFERDLEVLRQVMERA